MAGLSGVFKNNIVNVRKKERESMKNVVKIEIGESNDNMKLNGEERGEKSLSFIRKRAVSKC